MKIGLASDHGGFEMKEEIKGYLKDYEVEDYGTYSTESVDYPDYGKKLAEAVISKEVDFGIAFCGTGIGISISCNKVKGIRAALCFNEYMARKTREHNNANILCIGGRTTGIEIAKAMIDEFLNTDFEGGRHQKRVDKICKIEEE